MILFVRNWWWNEMGTPNWMINTMLLLDDDLTDKQKTEGLKIASRASLTGCGCQGRWRFCTYCWNDR
jgi:chondroitin AC lyase